MFSEALAAEGLQGKTMEKVLNTIQKLVDIRVHKNELHNLQLHALYAYTSFLAQVQIHEVNYWFNVWLINYFKLFL